METEEITIEYEGEEFSFNVEQHYETARIHIYVKEIWWGVPRDAAVAEYINALRYHAKRIEALVANGWDLETSDGEHLYFVNRDFNNTGDNPHKVTEQLE